MRQRTVLIIATAVAILALAALVVAPKLTEQAGAPMLTQTRAPAAYWPTESWRTSTPEEQGFDSAAMAGELQKMRDDGVPIDSLLIIRNGYVVLDAYFQPYDGTFPHNMASVTKTFTTTLIGIAAGQGKLTPEAPMLDFFPERSIANVDGRKKSVTVLHLAGMMNGFESGCLAGDEPTLNAMRSNVDWVQAALDRKLARDPGLAFCYDSPGMHILSAIIQQSTGMTEFEFGKKYLFEPLGIRDVIWPPDPQGVTHGWGDLHLKPLDAAKLGYLWLQNGVWDGQQIVPASWVAEAVSFHNHATDDDYGYGWWIAKDNYYAVGRGGQFVRAYPAYQAIVVTTAAGLDFDQVDPLLRASFVSPDRPLPANPTGAAQLQAVVAALKQAPPATVTESLPETARSVSGRIYTFGQDAARKLNLSALRFEFDGTAESSLFIHNVVGETSWRIGLDGRFRQFGEGVAARGYWSEPQTFIIETFDIGRTTYQMRFDGDRLLLTSPNFAEKYEGVADAP